MINWSSRGRTLTAILLAGAAATVSAPVLAQAEAAPAQQDTGLAEIVVTAQKRAQNLQDVGISITALSPTAMKAVPSNDATQLANLVPSLQVNQYSPSLTVYNLRGVSQNDFSDHQEAPIAFYNDEVYIGALGALAGQTFDLERMEVLRGPQGTLFGRNATGGLIQAVTAKPTKSLEGYATLGGGSYGQFTTEAAISGPITDHLRARLAVTSDNHGGYYTQVNPNIAEGGNARFFAVRGQIEADVGSGGLFRLKVEHMRDSDESSGALTGIVAYQNSDGLGVALPANQDYYGTGPGNNPYGYRPSSNPFASNMNVPGRFDRRYWNVTGRYEQDLGFATLTSITNYQHLTKFYAEDTDASRDDLLSVTSGQRLYQISEELRLSGKTDRLNWVTGLYGLKIKQHIAATAITDPAYSEFAAFGGLAGGGLSAVGTCFSPSAFGGFFPQGSCQSNSLYTVDQNTKSFAAFGQAEYKFNDVFSAIVGGRYSWDWKDYNYTHFSGATIFGTATPLVEDYDFASNAPGLTSRTFKNWSGKIELDAHIARHSLVYVSVNRGTKSGGFNAPTLLIKQADQVTVDAPRNSVAIPFDQEVLTNFEGGFKLTGAQNRFTLNASAFHYNYKNYQAFTQLLGSQFIINYPARVTGVEFDFNYRPIPALNVAAFGTWLPEAKVIGVRLPGDGFTPGRITNTRMPQAPKWSFGGSLAYDFDLQAAGKLNLSTTWKYNSSEYFSIYNAPVELQKSYAVGNARATYTPASGNLEFALFVNNLTDKWYKVFVSDNSAFSIAEGVYARPRWFGGSATVRFKR